MRGVAYLDLRVPVQVLINNDIGEVRPHLWERECGVGQKEHILYVNWLNLLRMGHLPLTSDWGNMEQKAKT